MKLALWVAAASMLLGAAMLVAGNGAPSLWIAMIAIGIVVAAIGARKRGTPAPP